MLVLFTHCTLKEFFPKILTYCLEHGNVYHLLYDRKQQTYFTFTFFYFSQKTAFDISCKLSPSDGGNLDEMSNTVFWEIGDNLHEMSKTVFWEK